MSSRLARASDRRDFLTRILENRDEDEVGDVQLAAQASDFVLAGIETTATALGFIVYYLFQNRDAASRLKHATRSSSTSYEAINETSTSTVEYLDATCFEGLRIYPPLPFALFLDLYR